MAVAAVLEPLIAAGLTVAVRPDGRLAVTPSQRITPLLDAHIRTHRDELIAALSAHAPTRRLMDWPPSRPSWWAEWMKADDERRRVTMAAGKARKSQR